MNKAVFSENFDEKCLMIKREFTAPLPLVWRAWTEPELLDQWWAPKPYKCVTKHMEFKEGGYWLYCMQGPKEDDTHWGKTVYLKIAVEDFFEVEDGFSDENGERNEDLPGTESKMSFSQTEAGTMVQIDIHFVSEDAMRQLIEMGAKEGTEMAYGNLDQLLSSLV